MPGWRHLALGDVGSTNTLALERAGEGDAGRLWITARRQLAGKARRGRQWVSEEGNLYASLLLIDPAPPERIGQLPLVAATALHRALIAALPEIEPRLSIKWPNDLLLDGRKLSGMLLEATSSATGTAIAIGCGINCVHHPSSPLYPSTSLADAKLPLEPQALFPHLAVAMADRLTVWQRGEGFTAIRADWLSRAAGIDRPITARFPDHEVSGTFENLDDDGHLLLRKPEGALQRISAADIFFGESANLR